MCVSDSLFYYVCHFQEDYVKWKDSLFFRFLSTLVDDELRRYGMYVYTYVLCMYALKFYVCTVRPIKKFTFRSYGTVIISVRI